MYTLFISPTLAAGALEGREAARCSRWLCGAAMWIGVGAIALPVAAQGDPSAADPGEAGPSALKISVGGSSNYDTNLFRRPDSANPLADTISTAYVKLLIDKSYSQQKFKLDLTSTAHRYDKSTHLNFDSLDYQGIWFWSLTPRVSGTVNTKTSESLAPFDETLGTKRSVRITDKRAFSLDGWIFGGWHLLLGASKTDQKSEEPVVNGPPDFRATSSDFGVQYVATSKNSLTLNRRVTTGDYLDQGPVTANSNSNDYREVETELKVNWMPTGKSSLNGRVAWIQRTNDTVPKSGYSGRVGDIALNWKPSVKLQFNASATKSLAPFRTATGLSFIESNSFSVDPTWVISAFTSASVRLSRTYSDFPETGAPGTPARKDIKDHMELSLTWAPTRSISVGASLQRQRRASNVPLAAYVSDVAKVNATLTF